MNSETNNLSALRVRLERGAFLSLTEPRDALAAYYALYHDPRRTQLWLHSSPDGQIGGFVAACQTGFNLFQPTVVLRARDEEIAMDLLRQALHPGRPYYVVTTPALDLVLRQEMQLEQEEINRVFLFDPNLHQPEINVLVQSARTPDGSPRFFIRSQGETASEAGVNWLSPHFAELYVHTQPWARERGWGKSVLSSCAFSLIQAQVRPLYMVSTGDEISERLAQSVGFVDTGAREYAGSGIYR
jgi:hypothetical protein